MSSGSSTDWNNWRAPGWRDLDNKSKIEDSVPFFIKNTSLRFLQIAFGERPKGQYRYEDNEENTEIKIADQHAFQLDAAEKKPAIISVRGPVSWRNIGLAHGTQTMNRKIGQSERTDLLHGSVGFSCISRYGLEADQLASDVFNLFKYFRTTLMKFGFFSVKSLSLGSEQLVEIEGEPKIFLVSVMMECQVQDRWVLEPKSAAELRNIVVSGLTDNESTDLKI